MEVRVFSKMDLQTGFQQIRVNPECIEKTDFNKKYGQFEYLVLPIGLCNVPATFQSLMNDLDHDFSGFGYIYMDYLLIYSKDEDSHYKHL